MPKTMISPSGRRLRLSTFVRGLGVSPISGFYLHPELGQIPSSGLGLAGIVTRGDLHKAPVRMWIFCLISNEATALLLGRSIENL